MADDPFDPDDDWHLPLPIYLRKIDAASHWGSSEVDFDLRVQIALAKAFGTDDGRVSVYLVRNRDDLRRIVVALDANRQSPGKKAIRFVAMSAEELRELTLETTAGCTKCRGANSLHRDIVVMSHADRLRALVERMIRADRKPRNFPKTVLENGRASATRDFCSALVASSGCACDSGIRRIVYWIKRMRSFFVREREATVL